jgi:hypothetical protein
VFSPFLAILIVLAVPLIILAVSVLLSLKCHVCRRTVGITIAVIGMLEMVGFFMFSITLNYIVYQIPYITRIIILIQGVMTFFGGIITLVSAQPKKTKEDIPKIAENQIQKQ